MAMTTPEPSTPQKLTQSPVSENPKKMKMKPCPICGESIKQQAKKCIHCREFIDEDSLDNPWPKWTGFNDRTLWEWMTILVVPLALGLGGLWFSRIEADRQRAIEHAEKATETAVQVAIQTTRTSQAQANKTATVAEEFIQATQIAQAQNNGTATAINANATLLAAQVAEETRVAQATGTAEAIRASQAAASIATSQSQATTEAFYVQATFQVAQTSEAIAALEIQNANQARQATRTAQAMALAEAEATAIASQKKATIQAAQLAESTKIAKATTTAFAVGLKEATKSAEVIEEAETKATASSINAEATIQAVQVVEDISCIYAGAVAETWLSYKKRLGCPQLPVGGTFVWQAFANGYILWSSQLAQVVLVVNELDVKYWQRIAESDIPEGTCTQDTPLLSGSIKQLWCSPYNARKVLGDPLAKAMSEQLVYQEFENGFILRDEKATIDYIFFQNGSTYLAEKY